MNMKNTGMKNSRTQKGSLTTWIVIIIVAVIVIWIGVYLLTRNNGAPATLGTTTATSTTPTGGISVIASTTPPVATTTPVSNSPITINITASTNTAAQVFIIQQDGSGVTAGQAYGTGTFSTLVSLVDSVGDVSTIPEGSCAKSASFGTETTITYNGKTSPDVQCVADGATPAETELATEVSRITNPN